MDDCAECGYGYDAVTPGNAADAIDREVGRLATLVAGADPTVARRSTAASWSALEYAAHVRDMLLVQRERLLAARREPGIVTTPMGRDERVGWGEYGDLTTLQASEDLRRAGAWLARSFRLLDTGDWDRVLVYNYPQRAERSLVWLAAHTVHELVHHRADVERLLHGDSAAPDG